MLSCGLHLLQQQCRGRDMTVVPICARASAAVRWSVMTAAHVMSSRASSSGCSALIAGTLYHPHPSWSSKTPARQHGGAAASLQPAARHRLATTWQCCAHASSSALASPAEGLSTTQQQQIDVFVSFLLEENLKYNLTGSLMSKRDAVWSLPPACQTAACGRHKSTCSCRRKGCRGGAEARARLPGAAAAAGRCCRCRR